MHVSLCLRTLVDKALQKIQSILDTTKHPRLLDVDVDHSYEDKFLLTETMTNTSIATLRTCLTRLGVTDEHWKQWTSWVDDKQTVTVRFRATDTCTFLKENVVEVEDPISVETTTTTSWNSSKKTTTKVKRKIKENHWKVVVEYSIIAFPGNNTEEAVTICKREASTIVIVGSGASTQDAAPPPIPPRTNHSMPDWNITWLLQQLKESKDGTMEGQFSIDRATAKTPRNNESVKASEEFHQKTLAWVKSVKFFFVNRLEKTILGKHNPVVAHKETEDKATTVSSLTADDVFCPFHPFLEDGAVMTSSDVARLLEAHDKSLDDLLRQNSQTYVSDEASAVLSVVEANAVVLCTHLQALVLHYRDCNTYLETVLYGQLVKAVGKEVTPNDFADFMRFHNHRLLAPSYAPTPFSYAVRRPGHAPDGILSIESSQGTPVETIARYVAPSQQSAPLQIPLDAATTVAMTGDWYLHGWMLHQFAGDCSTRFSLAARARQFSSFMLVIGTMAGAHKLEPKNAIILQNKDDLLIPLLTEVLPSAKDFKDAISSLSPEQQDFCKAYRSMQLESSVFGVAVIQLKPQLEKLLGLVPGSLTKEIQLTQDLMSLFVEYQIPSDLLSFDGPDDASKSNRLLAVKEHVKAVLSVVSNEKEKVIIAEEQKADYREAIAAPTLAVPRPVSAAANSLDANMAEAAMDDFQQSSLRKRSGGRDLIKQKRIMSAALPGAPKLFGAAAVPPTPASYETQPLMASMAPPPPQSAMSIRSTGGVPPPEAQPSATAPESSPITDLSPFPEELSSSAEDFTMLPKELDAKLEKLDTDNSLCSTVLKASSLWTLNRQENLLAAPKASFLRQDEIGKEKKKAFDLLEAISCSGSLVIEAAELHVVVALTHCFEKDLMNTVVEDNINPIAKAEKSTLLLASTVHQVSPGVLLAQIQDTERLGAAFPALFNEQ